MKRMDEMSTRMGDLEQSIANIMEQAGVESTASSATTGKEPTNPPATSMIISKKSEPTTMEI